MNQSRQYLSSWWSVVMLAVMVAERVGGVPLLSCIVLWLSTVLIVPPLLKWAWLLLWTWLLAVVFQVPWAVVLACVAGLSWWMSEQNLLTNTTVRLLVAAVMLLGWWWWILPVTWQLGVIVSILLSSVGVLIISRQVAPAIVKERVVI